jgi:hypothetical protein
MTMACSAILGRKTYEKILQSAVLQKKGVTPAFASDGTIGFRNTIHRSMGYLAAYRIGADRVVLG